MYVKQRNNEAVTRQYIQDMRFRVGLVLSTAAFIYLPNAEWIIHRSFGEPRSLQSSIALIVAVVGMMVYCAARYRDAMVVHGPESEAEAKEPSLEKASTFRTKENLKGFLASTNNFRKLA
jgi:hypothetical protein